MEPFYGHLFVVTFVAVIVFFLYFFIDLFSLVLFYFVVVVFFWKTLVNFSVRFKQGEVTRRMMKVLIPSSSDQPHLKPDESKQIVLIMKLLLQR